MAPWLGSARGTGGAVLAAALIVISVLPSATASAAAAATLPPQLHRPPAHPHNKQLSHGASPARRARPFHDSVPALIRLGQRAFVTATSGPPPLSVLPGTCFLEPRAPTSDAPRRRHGRRSARAQRPLPCRSAARGGARARPRPARAQGAHDNRTQVRDSGSAAPRRRAATSCRAELFGIASDLKSARPPPPGSSAGGLKVVIKVGPGADSAPAPMRSKALSLDDRARVMEDKGRLFKDRAALASARHSTAKDRSECRTHCVRSRRRAGVPRRRVLRRWSHLATHAARGAGARWWRLTGRR